ncbi:hypothetical protein CRG98_026087 [Punica granatum]|uniref:Uncharacterized protein n=1 Tax=Punica granatum TaxID=22663 RepID=A0A2I0JBB0_PUNGR|nr:hypothetical protein CRG98_026087 [Punica granatum]
MAHGELIFFVPTSDKGAGGGKGLGPSVGDPNPTTKVDAPTKDADNHGAGVRTTDWRLYPRIDWNLELEIPINLGARAPNQRPQPIP